MIILHCKKSLPNACVSTQIKCENTEQLKAVLDWIMDENMQNAPKWVFVIESIEYKHEQEQEPWVCSCYGEVIENPIRRRYDRDGNKVCDSCKFYTDLFEEKTNEKSD